MLQRFDKYYEIVISTILSHLN
ncbi:hypothetical protein H206_00117, partial [Candidatus Electrothrix aarhusensis]